MYSAGAMDRHGVKLGDNDGAVVGEILALGETLGISDGISDGIPLGLRLGCTLGRSLGITD